MGDALDMTFFQLSLTFHSFAGSQLFPFLAYSKTSSNFFQLLPSSKASNTLRVCDFKISCSIQNSFFWRPGFAHLRSLFG